ARERLALLMGFKNLAEFESAFKEHTRKVRRIYGQLLKTETMEAPGALPRQFRGAESEWKKLLAEHSFKDVEKSFRLLNEFANGPGYVHVSARTTELAYQLIPKLFSLCGKSGVQNVDAAQKLKRPVLSDPDRVLARVDSFV